MTTMNVHRVLNANPNASATTCPLTYQGEASHAQCERCGGNGEVVVDADGEEIPVPPLCADGEDYGDPEDSRGSDREYERDSEADHGYSGEYTNRGSRWD